MKNEQLADLQFALSKVGRDFNQLADSSQALFLFGSRAMGVANSKSDWDLLCINDQKSLRSKHVDIICVSPVRVNTNDWLGSELACHVSRFGKVLQGNSTWTGNVFGSEKAIAKKCAKITRRTRIVFPWWNEFAYSVRKKHFNLIKNDISRLNYLVNDQPVPPTPLLKFNTIEGFKRLVWDFERLGLLSRRCVDQLNMAADIESDSRVAYSDCARKTEEAKSCVHSQYC